MGKGTIVKVNIRVPECAFALLNRRLHTKKRCTDFSEAFRISDRPFDPELLVPLQFVPFVLEVER